MKGFKQYLGEARELPQFSLIRPAFDGVVIDGLNMVFCGQIAHWTTKNYATHEALGEFYNTLKDQLDHLVEAAISVGYTTEGLQQISLNTNGTDIETFENLMMMFRESVVDLTNQCHSVLSGIEDILVSILKTIDTMSYKLTLN